MEMNKSSLTVSTEYIRHHFKVQTVRTQIINHDTVYTKVNHKHIYKREQNKYYFERKQWNIWKAHRVASIDCYDKICRRQVGRRKC